MRRLLAIVLALVASAAAAGTNVGGVISTSATWTLAASPYTVVSDVTVDAGAVLTIEPGVTVYMSAGTSLVVQSGGILAQASAGSPIVVTSYRDVASPNPPPAPGDWGRVEFRAGTVAASARLDHVVVRYGNGIVIAGASPTLDNVASDHHAGAAITVDLGSSPAGKGLSATGNALNGIAVPAGDITGSVSWSLRGIPYVVTQGIVGVGAASAPASLGLPSSVLVAPGLVVPVKVTISQPAPVNGVSVTMQSADPAVASVATPVAIASGETSAMATVTGVAAGATTISATAAGYSGASAPVTVAALALDLQPAGAIAVPQGVMQSYFVTLSQPAPPGGLTVNVSIANPAVAGAAPSSIVIPAGQAISSATVDVTGVATGSTTLTLASPGLASRVVAVDVLGAGSLAFDQASVTLGKGLEIGASQSSYRVRLKAGAADFVNPAPVTVTLASADASKVAVPPTVVIPAGATSARLALRGVDLTSGGVALSASAAGFGTTSTPLSASVVAPGLAFDDLDGTRVTMGPRDAFRLHWTVPDALNPAQDTVAATPVDLAATAQAPAGLVPGFFSVATGGSPITQVTMPAGANAGPIAYVGEPTSPGTYAVTASVPGLVSSTSAVQTVTGPSLGLPGAVAIGSGLTSLGNAVAVTRTGDLSSPLTVSLSCSPAAVCTVPATVVIAASAASAPVAVTGVSAGSATLTAAATFYASATSSVTVATPTLVVEADRPTARIGGTIGITITIDSTAHVAAVAASDTVVSLASAQPAVAGIASTATIAAGARAVAGVPLTALAPGTTTVTASRSGFNPATTPTLRVIDNRLTLAPQAAGVAVAGTLPMTVSVADAAPAGGIVVSLSSSAPGFVSVPASVTIPAAAKSAAFDASGVATGSSTITARATNYVDATATVTTGTQSLSLPVSTMVARGLARTLAVTLATPAPAGGFVVGLASSNPAVAAVPASVTVPAGTSTADFDVTGGGNGIANVTASAAGASSAVVKVVVAPITLELVPIPNPDVSLPQGVTQGWAVQWSLPSQLSSLAPQSDLEISIATGDDATATASPSTLVIAVGEESAPIELAGIATGTTTLTLASPGLPTRVVDFNVLDPGAIAFSPGYAILGKGYVGTASVVLLAGGAPYVTRVPTTIALANGDPTRATLPSSATVAANRAAATFEIAGTGITAAPFVVQASSESGFATGTLPVEVLPPSISLFGLDGLRIAAGGRDQFFIDLGPPQSATLSASLISRPSFDLAITGAAPAGIVAGFFDQPTGGSVITQVPMPASPQRAQAFVAAPGGSGTYTVTASIAGTASTTSAMQVAAALGDFLVPSQAIAVGKGLVLRVPVTRAVAGNAFSSSDAVTLTLSSSDPSLTTVPPTATIEAGETFVFVPVTGVALTASPVTITIGATGYASLSLQVSVVTPTLMMNGLDVVRMAASARDDLYLSWFVPQNPTGMYQASASDIDVALTITGQDPPGLIGGFFDQQFDGAPVTSIRIPAGAVQGSGGAWVATPAAATGSYTVTATAPGIATVSSALQSVVTGTPTFTMMPSNDIVLGVGMKSNNDGAIQVYRTIAGYPFYGIEGVSIAVTSDNPGTANYPETLDIEAGQPSVALPMMGTAPNMDTLILSADGYASLPVPIVVVLPELVFEFGSGEPPALPVGNSEPFSVLLAVPNAYPFDQVCVDYVYLGITTTNGDVAAVGTPFPYVFPGDVRAASDVIGLSPGTFKLQAMAIGGAPVGAAGTSDELRVVP